MMLIFYDTERPKSLESLHMSPSLAQYNKIQYNKNCGITRKARKWPQRKINRAHSTKNWKGNYFFPCLNQFNCCVENKIWTLSHLNDISSSNNWLQLSTSFDRKNRELRENWKNSCSIILFHEEFFVYQGWNLLTHYEMFL